MGVGLIAMGLSDLTSWVGVLLEGFPVGDWLTRRVRAATWVERVVIAVVMGKSVDSIGCASGWRFAVGTDPTSLCMPLVWAITSGSQRMM